MIRKANVRLALWLLAFCGSASVSAASRVPRGLERPDNVPVIPASPLFEGHNRRNQQEMDTERVCADVFDAYFPSRARTERAACQECYVDPDSPNPSNPQYIFSCDFSEFCNICSPEDDVCYDLTRKYTVLLEGGNPRAPRGVAYSACGKYKDENTAIANRSVCLDETYDAAGNFASRCVSVDGVDCQTCDIDEECGRYSYECSNIESGLFMTDCDLSINDGFPKDSVFVSFNYDLYLADTESCFDNRDDQVGNLEITGDRNVTIPSIAPTGIPVGEDPGPDGSDTGDEAPTMAPTVSMAPSFSSQPSYSPTASAAPSYSSRPSNEPSLVPTALDTDRTSSSPSDPMPSSSPSSLPSSVPSDNPSEGPSQFPSDVPSSLPSNAPTTTSSVPLTSFSITLSTSSASTTLQPPDHEDLAVTLSDVLYEALVSRYDNLATVVLRPIAVEDDTNIFESTSPTYQFEGEALFFGSTAPSDVSEQAADALNQLDTLPDDWDVTDVRFATDGPLLPPSGDEGSSATGRNMVMMYGGNLPLLATATATILIQML